MWARGDAMSVAFTARVLRRRHAGGMLNVHSEVTQILSAIEAGDPSAAEQLLPLVYEELRRLAAVQTAHDIPPAMGTSAASTTGATFSPRPQRHRLAVAPGEIHRRTRHL